LFSGPGEPEHGRDSPSRSRGEVAGLELATTLPMACEVAQAADLDLGELTVQVARVFAP
jgi:hypothetical protein